MTLMSIPQTIAARLAMRAAKTDQKSMAVGPEAQFVPLNPEEIWLEVWM